MSTIKIFDPEDVGPRDWGREILVAHIYGLCTGKLLIRKAGTKGGLQYHRKKNESQYLYSGEMLIEYDAGDGKLTEVKVVAGQSWHIPPLAVHRETAITDCIIFEVSNPVFNDRVRVEDRYGVQAYDSLPTTSENEIEFK